MMATMGLSDGIMFVLEDFFMNEERNAVCLKLKIMN